MGDPIRASTPLCGDPTCESPGCMQAALDAWTQRQEDDAHRFAADVLGFCWKQREGEPCEVHDAA